MKVEIAESFSGYPDGKKRVDFDKLDAKGKPNIVDVPDDFGELIIKKGHAKAVGHPKEAPKKVVA